MNSATRELIEIFVRTEDTKEMEVLFREIFTPSEIDTLTLRWQLLKDLYEGKTQRKIAAEHNICTTSCHIRRDGNLSRFTGFSNNISFFFMKFSVSSPNTISLEVVVDLL